MYLGLFDYLALVLCVLLLLHYCFSSKQEGRKTKPRSSHQGYILHNQVTHARLLPEKSAHSFTYPTISLLVSLSALERGQLDLARGWIFGYGDALGRLTGLRSAPYLARGFEHITDKLQQVLEYRGLSATNLQDAWMMTMPSFVGFEGINPLTVYFCYNISGKLWLTVLEIHNTFGESHVHVLEVGLNENVPPSKGYDHEWTFKREFHVSPFNDRSGFYTVSIKSPTHSPMAHIDSTSPPKPSVRVYQYISSAEDGTQRGALKLTALLRPTEATPLTTSSWLYALARAPLALLLTFPRILYVAWILHYKKRLDVFLRPDPLPGSADWIDKQRAGGVKWLEEGVIETYARRRVEAFLSRRSLETNTKVTLVSADPLAPVATFSPSSAISKHLKIYYTSSRFFSIMFLTPSAEHCFLVGCTTEKLFQVSDKNLFLSIFCASSDSRQDSHWLQRLRCNGIPQTLGLSIPTTHFLDDHSLLAAAFIIKTSHLLDSIERSVFSLARARIVEGGEPWKQWERAVADKSGESTLISRPLGSVRRD